MSSSDARICLPQQLLDAGGGRRRMRKTNHSGPEIWLVCQRSVTTVDGCRTGSECPIMWARILVYIVGRIREILTSVAPLELRHARTVVNEQVRRGSEPSFS